MSYQEYPSNSINTLDAIEKETSKLMQKGKPVLGKLPGIGKVIANDGGVFYGMGAVTKETEKTKFSFPLRGKRAEIVRNIYSKSKNERRQIIEDEKRRIVLTHELYNSELSEVETDYGILGGQISILNADQDDYPPIIIFPGTSNDPISMESIVVEMALRFNRKIIVIGYPDGPDGKITDNFTKAVMGDYAYAKVKHKTTGEMAPISYKPHADYFHAQLQKLIPDGDFYGVGFSGGAALLLKLTNEEYGYGNHMLDALLLNPVSTSTFSDRAFSWGVVRQTLQSFADGRRFSQFTWRDDTRDPKKNTDKYNKVESWKALYNGEHVAIPEFGTARVKGNIYVYSGDKDYVARSIDAFGDTPRFNNPSLRLIRDKKAHHGTIATFSTEVVARLLHEIPQLKI